MDGSLYWSLCWSLLNYQIYSYLLILVGGGGGCGMDGHFAGHFAGHY